MSNDIDGRMLDQALVVYKAPVGAVDICPLLLRSLPTIRKCVSWLVKEACTNFACYAAMPSVN
jgi:hypothetical protein